MKFHTGVFGLLLAAGSLACAPAGNDTAAEATPAPPRPEPAPAERLPEAPPPPPLEPSHSADPVPFPGT